MSYLSYRTKLYKLSRTRHRLSKALHKSVDHARETEGEEKAREVLVVEGFDVEMVDHEILCQMTRHLVGKANRRFLCVPPISEELWEHCDFTGEYHLTDKGMAEMLKVIRADTKERTEIWAKWAGIVIGVLGAITGLVAVVKR